MTRLDSLIRVCSVGIAVVAIGSCGGDGLDGVQTKRTLAVTTAVSGPSAVSTAAGGHHTCAITNGGGAKCWGWNAHFELGDGTMTDRWTPVDTVGLASGVRALAPGWYHTCALTDGGGIKCWGDNSFGQIGDGLSSSYYRPTPADVVGLSSGAVAVAPGYGHTCAVTRSGGAKCWGRNRDGELGDGTLTTRATPVDVVGLSGGVTAIAAGTGHTCALTSAGGVKCWGGNYAGDLGDGTTISRPTPVDVVGLSSGVTAIGAGWAHSCALTSGGGVRCWGYNSNGQLGDGTTASRMTPVNVVGLSSGVLAIAVGGHHTCALTNAGGVKCWGSNGNGQLGDGTPVSRMTPEDVVGFVANEATNLENPYPGAPVSGIGLVSGWTCMSGVVEVSFDGGPRDNLVPSGGGRGDTLPVCGRTNTGFGLLFNYNLLGSGSHTVALFINGVQIGKPVPFTVTVPAGEFIRGLSKTVDVADFPSLGKTTRLEWQESTQNFAITGVR